MIATAKSIKEEMQEALRDIAGPRGPDDSIGALIRRAAFRSHVPYSRVFKMWYGNAALVRGEDVKNIERARREALHAKIIAQQNELELHQRELDEWL